MKSTKNGSKLLKLKDFWTLRISLRPISKAVVAAKKKGLPIL